MEQDLNIKEVEVKDFFKLEYKGQNVEKTQEFQKWYKRMSIYIKEENIRCAQNYLINPNIFSVPLLLISFCNECNSYVICSFYGDFSAIKCLKCNSFFCGGCLKKCFGVTDFSTCLKGYIKLLYLRVIYQRTNINDFNKSCMWVYYLLHILFCLFLTPFYIGFISFIIGLIIHQNKNRKENTWSRYENETKYCIFIIFSLIRGLLKFPYIILFLPFMVIILLPGIFSSTYYKKIFILYITAFFSGNYPLKIIYYDV